MSHHDEGETCPTCHVYHYDGCGHSCLSAMAVRQVGCRCEGCKAGELQAELAHTLASVEALREWLLACKTHYEKKQQVGPPRVMPGSAREVLWEMDSLGLTEDR
jgi:hypothetical protein